LTYPLDGILIRLGTSSRGVSSALASMFVVWFTFTMTEGMSNLGLPHVWSVPVSRSGDRRPCSGGKAEDRLFFRSNDWKSNPARPAFVLV
jgi:hypothetical protein